MFPHPLFQNEGAGNNANSVDVAVIVMPTAVSRCAMAPFRVVSELPTPTIDPQNEGTIQAWSRIFVRHMGAGRTDAGCANPNTSGISMNSLLNIVGGVVQDDVPPFQGVFVLPFPGFVAGESHVCQGDSGGPILSTDIDTIFGTNIGKDQVVSVNAARRTGSAQDLFSPVLQSTDIRTFLVDKALDRDGDGKEAWEDNCDIVGNSDQPDSDGDGIGDPCDTFPGLDDCGDEDLDGVPNLADPCVSNPDTGDADGDGILNCLDLCPNDAPLAGNPQDTYGDADFDGLCNQFDDCPMAPSSSALNCNDVSEEARQAEGLPVATLSDACDPVPCPSFVPTGELDPNSSEQLQYCVDVPAPFCPLDPGQKAWLNCASLIQFNLEVRALASHDATGQRSRGCVAVSS